jgi:hypothetical protein
MASGGVELPQMAYCGVPTGSWHVRCGYVGVCVVAVCVYLMLILALSGWPLACGLWSVAWVLGVSQCECWGHTDVPLAVGVGVGA